MKKKLEKLLLFDVDGVIADSFEVIYKDIKEVFSNHGIHGFSKKEFKNIFSGNPLDTIKNYLHKGNKINKRDLELVVASYEKVKLFKGMRNILMELSEFYTMAVVTSTIVSAVRKKFAQEGIENFFELYLGPQTAIHKDRKIQIAMKKLGVARERTVFISDTSGDIKEAKKTGVKTIAVTWGYQNKKMLSVSEPDYYVDNPRELFLTVNKIYE